MQLKGKFYERFNQILDRVFGNDEVSKHKFGGWLDYSMGLASGPTQLKKKRSSLALRDGQDSEMDAFIESLNNNGRALVRLLGKEDDGSIFQFLFRIVHPVEFKLELDMLPEQSKMSIMGRSAYTSVLFSQLLHKPLTKQFLDPRNPVLLVTIKELYLFYFLRHPASHQVAPSPSDGGLSDGKPRPTSIIGSLSGSFGGNKRKADYSWRLFVNDGVVSLTKGNPYNVLLLQYLRVFLPDTTKAVASRFHAKVLQHSNLFLHILIEFWLRQNLIVFSDDPTGQMDAITNARLVTKLSSPFASVHTYTSYMAPTDDLLSSLLLSIIHLLSDSFYPAALTVPSGTSASSSAKSSLCSNMASTSGGGYLSPSITVMRRPLYEFFRLVFSRAPIGLSPTAFHAITDVWLAYLQPWYCQSWARGLSSRPTTSGKPNAPDANTESSTGYTPAWESYVLANYHFYTTLLGSFAERAKELDFSGSDERNTNLLDRVLGVYNGDLLMLLSQASDFLEKTQPFAMPYSATTSNGRYHKSMDNNRVGLSSAQGHILSYYCKALGFDSTPIPLHGSYHRDAERLFDKLWADSGISTSNSDKSPTSSTPRSPRGSAYGNISAVLRSGFADHPSEKEKNLERVQRLSRSLRRVFEISDAYVASTNHARSMASTALSSGSSSYDPERDSKLPHLLTPVGIFQLRCGLRVCSPDSATYIGDPMLRPICSYEIPLLVRLSFRFSTWLNGQLGLRNPYHGTRLEDNLDVDPRSGMALFRFNFRFLASKVNLAYLLALLVLLYAFHWC